MGEFRPSEEVIAEIREQTDTVLLSFSTGKDAIASALALRGKFKRVIPYYLYSVPGLEFIEASLAYYERELFGGEHIVRLPHPAMFRWLNNFVFQPPERCEIIERIGFPEIDYKDINAWLAEDQGYDPEVIFTATGVRAADSPFRRMHFVTRGAINWNSRLFYPVYDWNKDRLIDAIAQSGVKLPIDYQLFGRSFDGLDLRFLYPIKKHLPRDYAKIIEWFPLAELEIFRYECAQRGAKA